VVFRNNNVFGNTTADYEGSTSVATGQNGNIGADPTFVDRENGNYRLLLGSPAIDAGYSGVVQPGERDLDFNERIHGPAVDIGAYEWIPAPGAADPRRALHIWSGLIEATAADVNQSNGAGSPAVDLLFAVRSIRSVSGLD
jgi:hypothetical protein